MGDEHGGWRLIGAVDQPRRRGKGFQGHGPILRMDWKPSLLAQGLPLH